jgi:hypothetical protein
VAKVEALLVFYCGLAVYQPYIVMVKNLSEKPGVKVRDILYQTSNSRPLSENGLSFDNF